MGKSLREALEEQMAALRAEGLAPDVMPDVSEPPSELPTNGHEQRPESPAGRRLGKRAAAKRRVERPTLVRTAPAAAQPPSAQVSPRPPGFGKVADRRAQQRRHEDTQREQIRQRLSALGGADVDDAALGGFMRALAHETGALPPLPVVLEALQTAESDAPAAVAEAVRRYYRRPRNAEVNEPPA